MDREARSELLTMMGLVAIVVAVVILVFFAFGYVVGLLLLSPRKQPQTPNARQGYPPRHGSTYTRGSPFPMPLALFGIGGALGLAVNIVVLFLIVVYLALIYWTYLDARRRIEDPVLIA